MDDLAIQKRYQEELEPLCSALASRLGSLLEELLRDTGIPIAQIEYRAKSIQSLMQKLDRKDYSDPLEEVKDLCGVRVVTYYQDDVAKVVDVLHKEFEVDQEHSLDKAEDLNVDEFGYRSFHVVIALKEPRRSLLEWRTYRRLVAEVQVRSVLQHGWAAISHKLDYKKASQAPRELRRKLFRLSALLELADEEFSGVRDKSRAIIREYEEDLDRGDSDLPLNLDSLRAFLQERVDLQRWVFIGEKMGMRSHPHAVLLGEENDKEMKRLLEALQAIGIDRISEVDQVLNLPEERIEAHIRAFLNKIEGHEPSFRAIAPDILLVVISLERSQDVPEEYSWTPFRTEFAKALRDLVEERNTR